MLLRASKSTIQLAAVVIVLVVLITRIGSPDKCPERSTLSVETAESVLQAVDVQRQEEQHRAPCQRDLADVLRRLAAVDVDSGTLARAIVHAGSGAALRRVAAEARVGRAIKFVTIGGSITGGAGMANRSTSERYNERFVRWFRHAFPGASHEHIKNGRSATGSNYWRFCYHLHVPDDFDVAIVDVTINDVPYSVEAMNSHAINQEKFLRALLARPQRPPAIILVGFPADRYRTAQDALQNLAVRYDLPLVSFREVYFSWILTGRFTRAELLDRFYGIKHGHPREAGHDIVGDLLIYYMLTHVLDCDKSDQFRDFAQQVLSLPQPLNIWGDPQPISYDVALDRRWTHPNGTKPLCLIVASATPMVTTIASLSSGWELWERDGKRYWRATTPSAVAAFPFTVPGAPMAVYLSSLKADYLNGSTAECWLNGTKPQTHVVVTSTGIGSFHVPMLTEVGIARVVGNHVLYCEMTHGNDFRIDGIFAEQQ